MSAQNAIPTNGVALLDFSASWCGPCRALSPVIDELSQTYDGRARVQKIDIDQHKDLALKMGIQSVPTVIVFKDGEEHKRLIGMSSKTDLQKALDGALS